MGLVGVTLDFRDPPGQFNFPANELAYIDSHAIVVDHQPLYGASAGASWRVGAYTLGADAIYSSGLRAGFADLEKLPPVVQVNLSAERSFQKKNPTGIAAKSSMKQVSRSPIHNMVAPPWYEY